MLVFHMDHSDPRCWFVVQFASRSKQTFEDRCVDMEMLTNLVEPPAIGVHVEQEYAWDKEARDDNNDPHLMYGDGNYHSNDVFEGMGEGYVLLPRVGYDEMWELDIELEIDLFGTRDLVEDALLDQISEWTSIIAI